MEKTKKFITIADVLKVFEGLPTDTIIVADANEGEVFLYVTGVMAVKADPEGLHNEEGVATPEMICFDVDSETSMHKVFPTPEELTPLTR